MRTVSEIGEAMQEAEDKVRKEYIISYLHKAGITHHAGTMLEDMDLRDLEPVYIKEKNKEAELIEVENR